MGMLCISNILNYWMNCFSFERKKNVVILLLICLILLFSERSTFAFLNRLTRFHAAREALGFSLYKYLTDNCVTVYCSLARLW